MSYKSVKSEQLYQNASLVERTSASDRKSYSLVFRANGKQKWIALGESNKGKATSAAQDIIKRVELGLVDPWEDFKPSVTVKEAIDDYIRTQAAIGRAEKTITTHMNRLSRFSRGIENSLIISVDASDINRFVRASNLSKSSQHSYWRTISAFFNWCEKKKLVMRSPTRDMIAPKKHRSLPKFLTKKEFALLIRTIEEDHKKKQDNFNHENNILWVRDIATFAVYTGLRRGEICDLKWSQIVGDQWIRIEEAKSDSTGHVPLHVEAKKVLDRLDRSTSYVFESPGGGQIHPPMVSRRFKFYVRKAGLSDDYKFHTLRHTYASWLSMAGVEINTIKAMMRHKNIETTEIYAHLSPDTLQKAATKI